MEQRNNKIDTADICIIAEGTYPYYTGGVSQWIFNQIKAFPDIKFSILAVLPQNSSLTLRYPLPDNVVGVKNVFLQKMKLGKVFVTPTKGKYYLKSLTDLLIDMIKNKSFSSFKDVIDFVHTNNLGQSYLLDSEYTWALLVNVYKELLPHAAFTEWFFSWMTLMGGLFAICHADIPKAKVYHSSCTGYAGLLLARAKLLYNKPCILTEHGIYNNERRLDISLFSSIIDISQDSFNISSDKFQRSLRKFWAEMFVTYSSFAYKTADTIIAQFEKNKKLQIIEGAKEEKTLIIPNGINYEKYSALEKINNDIPVIALIARVMPIKGIKNFIKVIAIFKRYDMPFKAYIIGSKDADKKYYAECVSLIKLFKIEECIEFTDQVDMVEYIPKIDVLVSSSLSEGQPLNILECGSSGIVTVATAVGATSELLLGQSIEDPPIGPGGFIVLPECPQMIAEKIKKLLTDKELYKEYSANMKKRVEKYYNNAIQIDSYRKLYDDFLNK